jgi:DNA-binding winged helix-turn-helix (wHTH) protein
MEEHVEVGLSNGSVIRFADFELDLKNRELRRNGVQIELQPQAFDILALLASRPGTLVTRAEVQSAIWPTEPFSDIHSRLNFQIKKIRQSLEDDPDNPIYIETVPKSGYKFIAPVQVLGPPPVSRKRTFGLTLAAVVVLVVIAGGFVIMKVRGRGSQLAKVAFEGDTVQAWNERGQLLWTHNFGQPLEHEDARFAAERIQIISLGSNSPKEVVVMAPLLIADQPNPVSDALYSFSSNGKVLWRHDFDDTLQFGGKNYGPPWGFGALMVTTEGREPSIWCAAREYLWSPSALVKLDGEGHLLAKFVNWGHIETLSHARSVNGSYVVAGGISNQCNCAMLAVLKEDEPSGSSPPSENGGFRCENCPEGRPYRYFLFPRSELNLATGTTYNMVKVIVSEKGRIRVAVEETTLYSPALGPDWEMYEFSTDFVPLSVSVSDHLLDLHRQLEKEGKIKHKVQQCPELTRPRTVRMWDPQHGWTDIQFPRVALP